MHSSKQIQWHTIIYSEYKYNEKQYNIEMLLNSQDFIQFIKSLDKKYNIVIWWDGTMLYALNNFHENKKSFIWINFGNKWFLLQDKKIILEKNDFIEKKYSIFQVEINWSKYNNFVNEVSLNAAFWKMGSFEIQIGNKQSFEMHSDWLIISSALGSTAYNSSLWWPIVFHETKNLILTSKATWKPKNLPSIVFPENEIIIIKNIWRFHGLEIYCDGQSKKIDEIPWEIVITKLSDIHLAINKNHLDDWENKILDF